MQTECHPTPLPEMWAGVEATICRVRDNYTQQLDKSGHLQRSIHDLESFASLGIKALRFPVLWEQVSPSSSGPADWEWPDNALNKLRELQIKPIIGLLHHGSGPRETNLLDPAFPELFARYAASVAKRYPWAEAYTPINEPLTTARFSALYGHWYPHAQDDRSFVKALLNQCKATVLAMAAIRTVNPSAQLVQTDDLGKIFGAPSLEYQVQFENERRWITWDLLCGRVNETHPMWIYFLRSGAKTRELEWFQANACPPNIIGVNHYLSSNRFLDDDLDRYPTDTHGGNGKHAYADVLAARVIPDDFGSPESLFREAWDRFGIPVAITEVHNGCTREEQLRWFKYIWDGAIAAIGAGADIRAVTAWSLLGSFDWNSLLTRDDNCYEPGVFDLRSKSPRPTAVAGLVRELAFGKTATHPVLSSEGWWQRSDRFHYGHTHSGQGLVSTSSNSDVRPLIITGATGTLGQAFARMCTVRGLPFHLLRRSEMDVADLDSVKAAIAKHRPWALINTAGFVRVDDAEIECAKCHRENAMAAQVLANACSQSGVRLLSYSSDLVFDGTKAAPYLESDQVAPLNEYGRSKVAAENAILSTLPSALVIRTSAFFGPWDKYNFVTHSLQTLAKGEHVAAAKDAVVSPTYVPDLVHASLDLLIDGEHGIWHLANPGATSWFEFAIAAAALAGEDPDMVQGVPLERLELTAPRPRYSVLGSELAQLMPPLEDALQRYFLDRRQSAPEHKEDTISA